MVRTRLFAALSVIFFGWFSASHAAGSEPLQEAEINRNALQQVGLGGMQRMSEEEAMQIRAKFVVFGTAGSGFFVTDVPLTAITSSKNGTSMPGQVIHNKAAKTTTIMFHPKFGTFTPGMK